MTPPGFGPMPTPLMAAAPSPPDPFMDVSDALPKHYQILDGGTRIIESALHTGGFYKDPEVQAVLAAIVKDLHRIIAVYPNKSGPEASAAGAGNDDGDKGASDIDPGDDAGADE